MQKEKIVPDIRFKGFDENFRIIKLNEIAEYRNGKGHENFVLEKGKYILVNSKFISSNGSQCKYTNINISPLLKNDIVMVLSDIPGGKALAKTFLIENDDKYALNQRICALTSKSTSPIYLNIILNRNSQLLALDDHVNQTNINRQQVMNLQLLIPSYVEQEKIGKLFSSLDLIIESQKSKLEKLQTIKQSLLNKMFIKNNQHMPSVRFNSYYDNWYYVNIQECSKVFIGLVTTMTTNYSKHGVLLIRNSDIKDGCFEFGENPIHLEQSFAMKNKSRMHMVGDVVTVHTGDVGTSAVVSEKEAKSIGFATIVTRPDKNKLDSSFLSVFLNTETHKKWAVQISTGDGRTNYNLGDYKLLNIPMTNLSEQQKIGQFFSSLDSLIHSQEQKLEKLNNIKQALLEKMFC
ncbi:restriction endonuclease subunit S [Mycoplasma sp. B6400]|uniref:restriction endonuclease subunit S n=1 Tax=Mycoplasma sp. B6400 TaxID=3401674 RepID=UPI003AAE30EC